MAVESTSANGRMKLMRTAYATPPQLRTQEMHTPAQSGDGSPELVRNGAELAKAAGLRYVRDDTPGITRKWRGRLPEYFDSTGKPIQDKEEIARINALAIP